MSPYTLAQKAKAVAALVGAIATALLGTFVADQTVTVAGNEYPLGAILTGLVAVCTYVVTFKIPNAPTEDAPVPEDPQVEDTH